VNDDFTRVDYTTVEIGWPERLTKTDREMQNEKYILIETSSYMNENKNTVKFTNYHRLLLLINPGT